MRPEHADTLLTLSSCGPFVVHGRVREAPGGRIAFQNDLSKAGRIQAGLKGNAESGAETRPRGEWQIGRSDQREVGRVHAWQHDVGDGHYVLLRSDLKTLQSGMQKQTGKIGIVKALFAALGGLLAGAALAAEPAGLTFYGWSDQHVATDGNVDHVRPFVDAMNALEGTPYPASVGGTVAKPRFVIGAGDITEWPTVAAMRAYDDLLEHHLAIRAYDVLGNHDDGGEVPSDTMIQWIKKRHGSLSYTFEEEGVRFIMLWSAFDPKGEPSQPLTREALDFLRGELKKVPEGMPVVIVTHLCYEAMTNKDDLVEAIGNANVILILGGHYHYAGVHRYRGLNWVQLPSPKSKFTEFTVIRITRDHLMARPYDFKKKKWVTEASKVLDVGIRGP
jgi:hypothetical protein